jgi:hypothetical protein
MKTIGWALVTFGFLWIMYTASQQTGAYIHIIGKNIAGIPKKESFTQGDVVVAINGVGNDLLYYEDKRGWTITPACPLLAGAFCLSRCARKQKRGTSEQHAGNDAASSRASA